MMRKCHACFFTNIFRSVDKEKPLPEGNGLFQILLKSGLSSCRIIRSLVLIGFVKTWIVGLVPFITVSCFYFGFSLFSIVFSFIITLGYI